jgi:hypothetical protein
MSQTSDFTSSDSDTDSDSDFDSEIYTQPITKQIETKKLFMYHSSHGDININNPLVDKYRNPPVYPLSALKSGQVVTIVIKNKASIFHTISVGELTKYGDLDDYEPDEFEDYMEIVIYDNKIQKITLANPTNINNSTMVVYDVNQNIIKDIPNIEFHYTKKLQRPDFNMGSFQIIKDGVYFRLPGDTTNVPDNVWASSCVINPEMGLENIEYIHGPENSYINNIIKHINEFNTTVPPSNLHITILNSSCLSTSNLINLYKKFKTWCNFYNIHMILGSKKTEWTLQSKIKFKTDNINKLIKERDLLFDEIKNNLKNLEKRKLLEQQINEYDQKIYSEDIKLNSFKKELQEYTQARNFITEQQNIGQSKIDIYKNREKPVFDRYENLVEKTAKRQRFRGGKLTQKKKRNINIAEFLFKGLKI